MFRDDGPRPWHTKPGDSLVDERAREVEGLSGAGGGSGGSVGGGLRYDERKGGLVGGFDGEVVGEKGAAAVLKG